jgi:formylglycine-generating enzyme
MRSLTTSLCLGMLVGCTGARMNVGPDGDQSVGGAGGAAPVAGGAGGATTLTGGATPVAGGVGGATTLTGGATTVAGGATTLAGGATSGGAATVATGGALGTGGTRFLELCGIALEGGCKDGVVKGAFGPVCSPFTVNCENGCSAHPSSVEQYSGYDRQIMTQHVTAALCAPTPGAAGGGAAGAAGGGAAGAAGGGATTTGGGGGGGALPNIAGNVNTGCTGALEETIQIGDSKLCVAKMATITGPTATTNYRIDATEVTRGQYEAWVATNPKLPASTDASCGWKAGATAKKYAATSSCMSNAEVCQSGCEHHPQVCVDWCDANLYCKAVGKRLCGAIGAGSSSFADVTNATTDQWYRACTSAGTNAYPYGSTYDGKRCNGYDYWDSPSKQTTVPVGSLVGCQSTVPGYTGVFDLVGNTREWEDSCSASGVGASCALRGGALNDSGGSEYSFLSCNSAEPAPPDMAGRAGFRCCADEGTTTTHGIDLVGLKALSIKVSGGMPRPGGDTCPDPLQYALDFATKVLTWSDCVFTSTGGPSNGQPNVGSRTLSDPEMTAVNLVLGGLSTDITKTCGADKPDEVLTLTFANGSATYVDDFYSGCTGRTVSGTYIHYLDRLISLVSAATRLSTIPAPFDEFHLSVFPMPSSDLSWLVPCASSAEADYGVTAATQELSWWRCLSPTAGEPYARVPGSRVLSAAEFASVAAGYSALVLGASGDCTTARAAKMLTTSVGANSTSFSSDVAACSPQGSGSPPFLIGLDALAATVTNLAQNP